jgi:hypothetical protein
MDKLEVEKVLQWKEMKENSIFQIIITNPNRVLESFKEELWNYLNKFNQ